MILFKKNLTKESCFIYPLNVQQAAAWNQVFPWAVKVGHRREENIADNTEKFLQILIQKLYTSQ